MSPEKRFDTSSVSFLESLDYDPMEGPSWLFESLRKRKKRKSAGSSSGSRKRRKATRRSSPFILDSPNLSGTKSTTPESSPSIVDASKFLSGLKASAAKSLSPGPENKSVNSDDEENISGFQQAPRRLSLDSSCLGAGSRTPLREITLEPQGEVFTYNPRVDSGQVVQGIREARINIRNTPEIQINRKLTRQSEEIRTRSSLCKADQMNERESLNLQNNADNILGSTLLVQNISLEVDNLISSYNGGKVQIRTPKVNVSNDEVRRSRASLDIAQIQEVEDNHSNEEQIDIENIQKVVDQLSPAVPEKVENRRTSRRRTTLAEDFHTLQAGNQGEASRQFSKPVEKNDEIDTDDIQTVDDNRKKSTTSRLSKRASRKRHTSGKTKNQLDTFENDIAKDVENEVNSVAKVGFSVTESEEIEEPTNDPLNNDSSKLAASKNIGKKATRGKSADSRLNVETDLELDKPSRTVRRVAGKSADSRLGLNTNDHFEGFGPSKTTEEDMKTSSKEDTRKSRKDEVRKSTREDIRKSTKRTSKIQNGAETEDDISVDEDDLVSIGSADSNSNYGGGESDDEMGEEGEGCGGRRPSRRATAKTSYAEPSLRRKMRQGDPGTSSVDPGFVPQIKKKTKK